MIGDIAVLTLLIIVNGLLAATEIALLSINANKVKLKADEGNKTAILLKKTLENPSKFLSTIQVGISLSGLFSGAFAAASFSDPIVTFLVSKGVSIPLTALRQIITIVITLTLSYFSLVFGELVPKRIAMKIADSVAAKAIRPINAFAFLATPFIKLLSASTNLVLRIFGFDTKDNANDVTEEEIRMLVDVGEEAGTIDENEKEMINNIFEFDNKTADDIAMHRKDIVALSINSSYNEIVKIVVKGCYSRIPVYEDNIDNIIGILHVRDILHEVLNNGIKSNTEINLRTLIRKPYFVPISKKTDELFEEMQKNKVHMAIVVDEYGGTVGLVTMEDLIEEIMGNIFDEYDEEESPEIDEIDNNTFVIDGQTSLDTVSDFLDIPLPVDDYDTVGGFVIGQIGRIPKEGQQPEIEFEGLIFKVYKVIDKRIASVIVCKVR